MSLKPHAFIWIRGKFTSLLILKAQYKNWRLLSGPWRAVRSDVVVKHSFQPKAAFKMKTFQCWCSL